MNYSCEIEGEKNEDEMKNVSIKHMIGWSQRNEGMD